VQVQLVFQIPSAVISQMFSPAQAAQVPTHLVYVEWFNPIPSMPDSNHGMYRVSRLFNGRCRHASIILLDAIVSSIQLFPRIIPNSSPLADWNSFTVLEHCNSFYINPFSDRDIFLRLS